MHVIVVGAGAVGLASARVLRARGARVTVVERGKAPHPEAASVDLSKLIRGDYGLDAQYTELMEDSLERWRERNCRWRSTRGRELFHETGFLVLSSVPFESGGYEHDSFSLLSLRGYPLERLDGDAIGRRFPVFGSGAFVDGYVNPRAGWAESGEIVAAELADARAEGVEVVEGFCVRELVESGGVVIGLRSESGVTVEGDVVVVAAGAWSTTLVPELSELIVPTGHPVLVVRPGAPEEFLTPRLLPWAADIGRRGWYGFSANREGLVKVANHGKGYARDVNAERSVPEPEVARFREFLRCSIPKLAEAPTEFTRLCFYADTFDGDFLIDAHPERPGLVVATGDSGHAFKFMPVLGELVADAVEGRDNRYAERFRWRRRGSLRAEQARCRD